MQCVLCAAKHTHDHIAGMPLPKRLFQSGMHFRAAVVITNSMHATNQVALKRSLALLWIEIGTS